MLQEIDPSAEINFELFAEKMREAQRQKATKEELRKAFDAMSQVWALESSKKFSKFFYNFSRQKDNFS